MTNDSLQNLIDPMLFKKELSLWLDWTGQKLSKEETIERYYLALSEKLSTEEFLEASKLLFTKKTTLPTVEEFSVAIEGEPAVLARIDWLKVEKIITGQTSEEKTELSDKGRLSLEIIGGVRNLQLITVENLEQKKQEFISVYFCLGNTVLKANLRRKKNLPVVKQLSLNLQPA